MTYEEFLDFVPAKCMYETIYDDSDGRPILVIRMLDAYGMVNKAQRPWVGLTDAEKDGKRVLENGLLFNAAEVQAWELGIDYAEAKLKERNA
jgi:hypothetical protein